MNNSTTGLKNDPGNVVEHILAHVFSAMFGMIALLGNSLVVFVIGKFSEIRKEIPCIYLIGYLALADGFTGWYRSTLFLLLTATPAYCFKSLPRGFSIKQSACTY